MGGGGGLCWRSVDTAGLCVYINTVVVSFAHCSNLNLVYDYVIQGTITAKGLQILRHWSPCSSRGRRE